MNLKTVLAAAAIALAPVAASAATIGGELGLFGNVTSQPSDYTSSGSVDIQQLGFASGTADGRVGRATGSFADAGVGAGKRGTEPLN